MIKSSSQIDIVGLLSSLPIDESHSTLAPPDRAGIGTDTDR